MIQQMGREEMTGKSASSQRSGLIALLRFAKVTLRTGALDEKGVVGIVSFDPGGACVRKCSRLNSDKKEVY